jgi:hypothetical protein
LPLWWRNERLTQRPISAWRRPRGRCQYLSQGQAAGLCGVQAAPRRVVLSRQPNQAASFVVLVRHHLDTARDGRGRDAILSSESRALFGMPTSVTALTVVSSLVAELAEDCPLEVSRETGPPMDAVAGPTRRLTDPWCVRRFVRRTRSRDAIWLGGHALTREWTAGATPSSASSSAARMTRSSAARSGCRPRAAATTSTPTHASTSWRVHLACVALHAWLIVRRAFHVKLRRAFVIGRELSMAQRSRILALVKCSGRLMRCEASGRLWPREYMDVIHQRHVDQQVHTCGRLVGGS